jgi:hypothetical protein
MFSCLTEILNLAPMLIEVCASLLIKKKKEERKRTFIDRQGGIEAYSWW